MRRGLRVVVSRSIGGAALVGLFVFAGAAPAVADATVYAPKGLPGRTTMIDVWCGAQATSASVNVMPFGGPPELPLEPYPAGGPGAFRVAYVIPAAAAPGSYGLRAECDDGLAGDATLVVGLPAGPPTVEPAGGSVAQALVASVGIVVALAGAGFVLARRFGPRSRLGG
ncbi:hypothetical protein [Asanoa siamensis]|uniref:MYXO-CTERM domain-containing protein n=1 Tax=Asanoa siamensis TaxID=926357 RepID=A0ABQ4CL27_9ACTN|nr:hypothetical protein [Asanoa siamensis]GIF71984.1 hypothetical protein Asi02nite_15020 [Asanoa siamensis]